MRFSMLPPLATLLIALHATAQPPATAPALRISIGELSFLQGQWRGTLSYRDFSDGSRQTIGASLTCRRDGESLIARLSYVEPNGRKIEGNDERIAVKPDEMVLSFFGADWQVVEKKIDLPADAKIVLRREGTDNERPAKLFNTITLSGNSLKVRKDVRYADANEMAMRNEYVLEKE